MLAARLDVFASSRFMNACSDDFKLLWPTFNIFGFLVFGSSDLVLVGAAADLVLVSAALFVARGMKRAKKKLASGRISVYKFNLLHCCKN